jgi:hypothetical protein
VPSLKAYLAVIKAYVYCQQWGTALEYIAEAEQSHLGSGFASVYGDLGFFPVALDSEVKLAAAFAQLQERQVGELLHVVPLSLQQPGQAGDVM